MESGCVLLVVVRGSEESSGLSVWVSMGDGLTQCLNRRRIMRNY